MPQTFHPNAASISTSPTPTPQNQQHPKSTAGGDSKCNKALLGSQYAMFRFALASCAELGDGSGPRKERGAERMPTRKAREKLRVASVERNMPSRSREKDFIRRVSCAVGGVKRARIEASIVGRTRLETAKRSMIVGRAYGDVRCWIDVVLEAGDGELTA